MIITRLVGGLGNQMFQYASAFAVAKENNTNLYIDKSWYEEKNSTVWTMKYELDVFNITSSAIDPKNYSIVPKLKILNRLKRSPVIEYKEKSLLYDEAVFHAGKNLVMDGYWQSEKFFLKYRKGILKEFSFKNPVSEKNKPIIDEISNTNSVSLHVRRGDYASNAQTTSTHGLMTLEYYNSAIKSIAGRVNDVHLFIFSDEPEWCEANLKLDQPHTFISGNQGYEDMRLMASCHHHILANSSFSWWGAWLNDRDDKIVIAPKKWFNDTSLNSEDIVPKSWERI